MRFLKGKIARAMKAKGADLSESESFEIKIPIDPIPDPPIRNTRTSKYTLRSRDSHAILPRNSFNASNSYSRVSTSNNNIMKNYSRAMLHFTESNTALPYLQKKLEQYGIQLARFQEILNAKREKANCIKGFRELLLIYPHDDQELISFKKAFQAICEVFLKFFSVNWIFNSKINDKILHLKYRGKMLRRVRNPQYFTYLEGFTKAWLW